ISRGARNRHRALHRRDQRRPPTLPVDRTPKPHPRGCQTWEANVRVDPLETSNREQTRQSRSDALRTMQGIVVGRIIKAGTPRPFGTPWMCHEDRTPTHGYELTREAAMAAVRE